MKSTAYIVNSKAKSSIPPPTGRTKFNHCSTQTEASSPRPPPPQLLGARKAQSPPGQKLWRSKCASCASNEPMMSRDLAQSANVCKVKPAENAESNDTRRVVYVLSCIGFTLTPASLAEMFSPPDQIIYCCTSRTNEPAHHCAFSHFQSATDTCNTKTR